MIRMAPVTAILFVWLAKPAFSQERSAGPTSVGISDIGEFAGTSVPQYKIGPSAVQYADVPASAKHGPAPNLVLTLPGVETDTPFPTTHNSSALPQGAQIFDTLNSRARPVGPGEDPVYTGLGNKLASKEGSPLSPLCRNASTWTQNGNASDFVSKHASVPESVAELIEISDDRAVPIGTAVLARPNVLISAAHVLNHLVGPGWHSGQQQVSQSGQFFALFGLKLGDLDYATINPGKVTSFPSAVRIAAGAPIYNDPDGGDIGGVALPLQVGRSPVQFAVAAPSANDNLIVVGVPGEPNDTDATSQYYENNYSICGSTTATMSGHEPIAIRFGAGKLIGVQAAGELEIAVDTLDGNSGSPVFDQATGVIVGINVSTEDGYAGGLYNDALPATQIPGILAKL
jgi:Trypsin-like peptidase domain